MPLIKKYKSTSLHIVNDVDVYYFWAFLAIVRIEPTAKSMAVCHVPKTVVTNLPGEAKVTISLSFQ